MALLGATACATSAPAPSNAPHDATGCPNGQGPGCRPATAQPGGPGAMHHGAMAMGTMQGHGMMGGGMMGMPPADVRAEDLPQGARLTFTPKDPKDLEALRQHLSEHATHAHPGSCPMMSMHGGAHAEAAPAQER